MIEPGATGSVAGSSLTPRQRELVENGFVRIENAFPRRLVDAARDILWRDSGCDSSKPAGWNRPVVRLGNYDQPPFLEAANTPALHAAYDELVGRSRWTPPPNLGSFVLRFPDPADPGDTGWHVDASFPGPGSSPTDYLSWRINVHSSGRALLMLFLFSDVSEQDAPTRLCPGSHLDVARILEPAGESGLSVLELAAALDPAALESCRHAFATGAAGTVYLCHPFLVHAGQAHRGEEPRFLAQPPLFPASPLQLERKDASYSAVEIAIRTALGRDGGSQEPVS